MSGSHNTPSSFGSGALLTDLYQLTMAQGYWKSGLADRESVFHLFFRRLPFSGGYAIAAGLESAVGWLEAFRFESEDLEYLTGLTGSDAEPLFEPLFLEFLESVRFDGDLDALREGTLCFPHEPLLRVRASLLVAQLVETYLLNQINFQTLIATKAARVCRAAGEDPVLEFGLRRAQGVDGALTASRAAYLGGCAATSNVLAGKRYGIPVKGTHAHSWVMVFEDELESFQAYARAMPNNCVFLVDTFDTIRGVRRAIEVGRHLRESGHEMLGVRLDSGDLATLSIEARRLLDEAGFESAQIVASNDLDEAAIEELKEQGARIGVWGVGTKLVTCHDQPALGGVYKLAALREVEGSWRYTLKCSEDPIKVSIPGILQVRRFCQEGRFVSDLIYDESLGVTAPVRRVDLEDPSDSVPIESWSEGEDLLVPVLRGGRRSGDLPSLESSRGRAREQMAALSAGCRERTGPDRYPVGIEPRLSARRELLIQRAREETA
ncbi:MAG: nicotinate phosphoribosyltransferase [Planctomycetota bacterium]|nr:nicotinate phosphoribosyltransferase [Planctomycetota bacterium]